MLQASTLVQLAVIGSLVAVVPLGMVWMSADTNKYRKLVWVCAFLTFDLIMFGAFTRLSDSGLGCPDWPGCYGMANPFLAHEQISAAQALMPSGPVSVFKAWVEMSHRYLAMGIGVLIITLLIKAVMLWRTKGRPECSPALPFALFLMVCVQGAFGAWTVTQKLQPVIVTIHLVLGMGLLAMVTWLGARLDQANLPVRSVAVPGESVRAVRALALASALLLAFQIALGGWVSTNYATLACTDYPLCQGRLIPPMDARHGFTLWRELGKTATGHYLPFPALTAIHWVHRNVALLVALVLGLTVWRAWRHPALRANARALAIVLVVQFATGIATIFLNWPLAIAVLHNGGAALLVLLVTMLNYRAKHHAELVTTHATGAAGSPISPA